jgi:hypothetical protein
MKLFDWGLLKMATSNKTIKISVSIDEAMKLIAAAIDDKMVSVNRLQLPDNKVCIIAVYEKYYLRMGASSVATVTFDDIKGSVRVSCICAGTGTNFELGSNTNFQKLILDSLKYVTVSE